MATNQSKNQNVTNEKSNVSAEKPKKQVTITSKQVNRGMREIISLTSQMGQVLKQLSGLYGTKLKECNDMTVEQYMSMMGVERKVKKNGQKDCYTPTTIAAGWHEGMFLPDKLGKPRMCIFRNVPALYLPNPEDPEFSGFDKYCRVYTYDEAIKSDGKPISRYMLMPVANDKWSIATILKGLKQTREFDKENEKMVLSELEWNKLDKVYIVRIDKQEDGSFRRVVREVWKDCVQFGLD